MHLAEIKYQDNQEALVWNTNQSIIMMVKLIKEPLYSSKSIKEMLVPLSNLSLF